MEKKASFCSNCGTRLDGGAFCTNCGARVESEMAPKVNPYQPQQSQASSGTPHTPRKFSKKLGIIIGAVVAVVAIALVVVLCVTSGGGGGYKGAVSRYEKYKNSASLSDAKKLVPDDVFEAIAEEENLTVSEAWDSVDKNYLEGGREQIKTTDGRISISANDAKKLDKDNLEKLIEEYEGNFGVDGDKIKEAYEVELTMKVNYDGEDITQEADCTIVNYDGTWYIVEAIEEICWNIY